MPKGQAQNYKSKGDLPIEIRNIVLPNPEMLGKCLHDKTQNANKSFNCMIWNRVPKSTQRWFGNFASRGLWCYAHFNYGEKAALDIIKLLKISQGVYTIEQAMPKTQLILQNVRITKNSSKNIPPFQNKAAG